MTSQKDKNNAVCELLHRKHQFVQCHSSMTLFIASFHAVTKTLGVHLQQSQMSQFGDWEECGAFLSHQNHNSSGICCVKAPSLLTQDSWSLSLSLSSQMQCHVCASPLDLCWAGEPHHLHYSVLFFIVSEHFLGHGPVLPSQTQASQTDQKG